MIRHTRALSGGWYVGRWPLHAFCRWALVPINRLVQVEKLHFDALILITNVGDLLVSSKDRNYEDLQRAAIQVKQHFVM